MFVVHEAKKKWILIWDDMLDRKGSLEVSEKEARYSRLWKDFCKTIAIESRTNRRCQLQHLPLRFRPNMVEFTN